MKAKHLILSLVMITSGCHQSNSSFTDLEKNAIAEDIRKTLNNYYTDIRNEGLMAELKYLDNSNDFYWVPPGYSTAISYDSVVTVLKKSAPQFKSVNNSWDTLRINPLSKVLATYTGRLHSIVTDTSETISEFKLVETGLLIKRQDGWKLLSGQTSMID